MVRVRAAKIILSAGDGPEVRGSLHRERKVFPLTQVTPYSARSHLATGQCYLVFLSSHPGDAGTMPDNYLTTYLELLSLYFAPIDATVSLPARCMGASGSK